MLTSITTLRQPLGRRTRRVLRWVAREPLRYLLAFAFSPQMPAPPGQACSGQDAEPAKNEVCLATASGVDTMITGARATLVWSVSAAARPRRSVGTSQSYRSRYLPLHVQLQCHQGQNMNLIFSVAAAAQRRRRSVIFSCATKPLARWVVRPAPPSHPRPRAQPASRPTLEPSLARERNIRTKGCCARVAARRPRLGS